LQYKGWGKRKSTNITVDFGWDAKVKADKANIPIGSAWAILFVLLVASVAAPINQFKVPPVMPLLMEAFSLPMGRAGLLMSVFAITGLLLALPAGFICQKIGYRAAGLLAVGSVIIGSALGALSMGTGSMLASRVIEGLGASLMGVVAPAVIAISFVADKRGAPMGVWATWVPLGSTAMFLVAPWLAGNWGWRGVWWFGCLFAVVGWLLFYILIKPDGNVSVPLSGRDLVATLRNRDLWLLSLVFCCFNIIIVSFSTWFPTFLHKTRGISLAEASFLTSFTTMIQIFTCPFGGWVSDRIRSRKIVCLVPMIIMGMVFTLLVAAAGIGVYVALVVVLGTIGGFVPTGVFSGAVEVVKSERLGGMAMAIIMVGQNTGMLLGPVAFGWIVESSGNWVSGFLSLVPVCVIGAVTAVLVRMR
jgi:MFS family permease